MKLYKITHLHTKKAFIGVTDMSPRDYYSAREDDAKIWDSKFLRIVKVSNFNDWEFTLLDNLPDDEAFAKQTYYIFLFNTFKKGYQSNYGTKFFGHGYTALIKVTNNDNEIERLKMLNEISSYKIRNIVTKSKRTIKVSIWGTLSHSLPYDSNELKKLIYKEIDIYKDWVLDEE